LRSAIFDLDGTLADTSADLIAAANHCFRGLGLGDLLNPVADKLTAFHGGRAMLKLGFSRVPGYGEAEIAAQYPVLLAAYEAGINRETKLYPGAAEAIEALLRAGFAAAICTNKPEALAELLLARLGVRGLFGAVIGADTLAMRKPDPAPFRAAIARAGGTEGRAFLLGDTETDVLTARAANAPVALVSFGPEGESIARLSPDALLHAFADLPALAERLMPLGGEG
jgi:phosphoglycolate phosphatase